MAALFTIDNLATLAMLTALQAVLGLFVLFIVGILLLSEGGSLAQLQLFGFAVEPMSKTTFYFVIFIMVMIDIVQGRYQKKLMAGKPGGA